VHIPTILRKCNYYVSGGIALSDAVRNFAYRWAWSVVRSLPQGSRICDIGSRGSLFPAFLAWRGYTVDIVEKDERFTGVQKRIARSWNVPAHIHETDFLAFGQPETFHAVCSLFSLQHAGENDAIAYRRAADLLVPGGCFFPHANTMNGKPDGTKAATTGPCEFTGPKTLFPGWKSRLFPAEWILWKECTRDLKNRTKA
jgi:2-polyprenyl-3-methyl-5-hydroxy-6-metoxy-1,4-benzoquinol methylase